MTAAANPGPGRVALPLARSRHIVVLAWALSVGAPLLSPTFAHAKPAPAVEASPAATKPAKESPANEKPAPDLDLQAARASDALSRPGAFTAFGEGLRDRERTELVVHGYFRTRGELLGNLDLDHGLTPSGRSLYPVPLADPAGQTLTHADLRGRLDFSLFPTGSSVAVRGRVDLLDNLALGSAPEGPPSATTGQRDSPSPVAVRRLWGEVLLPFGLLAAGRMGAHWGAGLLSHGGDCLDCDSATVSDRVALVSPLAGKVWAVAFDLSSSGPQGTRAAPGRTLDLDPRDDVRTLTLAMLEYTGPRGRARRSAAGRWTVEYGVVGTWRWQSWDQPAHWLAAQGRAAVPPEAAEPAPERAVKRDFRAAGGDLWLRVESRRVLVEAEGAALWARFGESSLVPGVSLNAPVSGLQLGAVVRSRFGSRAAGWSGGLDLVFASGDPAPGFGADQQAGAAAPRPGDLDGPQSSPPGDARIDNFRAHSDLRVDRILFREIIGRVTDAWVARPHVRWRGHPVGAGRLDVELAVVASAAHQPNSTPSGARPLGVEIDPTVSWRSRGGFRLQLQGAWLKPLAGLDNAVTGAEAQPAWLGRVLAAWEF